jgi:hypothetical protein
LLNTSAKLLKNSEKLTKVLILHEKQTLWAYMWFTRLRKKQKPKPQTHKLLEEMKIELTPKLIDPNLIFDKRMRNKPHR